MYVPASPSATGSGAWYMLVFPAWQREMVRVSSPSATGSSGTSQSLPARQGAVVRVGSPSAAGSSGTSHCVSQRDREQCCVLVLPARQGAVVRVGSPSAAGSSGACWFSQRVREQWCATGSSGILILHY